MNKTNNNSTTNQHRTPIYRRPLLWICAAIGVIIIIVVVIILCNINSKDQPSDSASESHTSSSSESKSDHTDSDIPQAEDKSTDPDAEPAPENKVTQYEGENPNDLGSLTGVVTSAEVDGDSLVIMATVDQYLNGTCTLNLTGNSTGDTYDAVSGLLADVSTSYCEPFTVPLSLLMNDYYDIEITLSGNGETGKIKDGVQL